MVTVTQNGGGARKGVRRKSLSIRDLQSAPCWTRTNTPLIKSQGEVSKSAEKTSIFEIGIAKWIVPVKDDGVDLLAVAEKWSALPAAVRAGILAIVNAAAPDAPAVAVDLPADITRRAAQA